VSQALLRLRAARLERDLFATTHVPQAEQALRASEIAYQTGKIDFLSLVDSLRAVEDIHLEHVRASSDLGKAAADLERAVGIDLPVARSIEEEGR
jgi:outer membrane protein TolC